MWNRKDLKERGKAAFQANYWKCVIVALILTALIGGGASTTGMGVNETNNPNNPNNPNSSSTTNRPAISVNVVVSALSGVVTVGFLGKLLLVNPLTVGCKRFFLVNSRTPAELGELLHGFRSGYGNVVVGMFMRDLFTLLWCLLFIIPGFVKAYAYQMVPYILAEEPGISGKDAMTRSQQMMKGQKWKAFLLDLSFFGWILLSVLSLGIVNVFWTEPYIEATGAELYQVLKYRQN